MNLRSMKRAYFVWLDNGPDVPAFIVRAGLPANAVKKARRRKDWWCCRARYQMLTGSELDNVNAIVSAVKDGAVRPEATGRNWFTTQFSGPKEVIL